MAHRFSQDYVVESLTKLEQSFIGTSIYWLQKAALASDPVYQTKYKAMADSFKNAAECVAIVRTAFE